MLLPTTKIIRSCCGWQDMSEIFIIHQKLQKFPSMLKNQQG